MAIRIQYQPPAGVIGGAAYEGGLGQFLQRQQAVALQQQELAQRDLAQRRALAAQQQAQMFGAQQDAMQRQAQAGMFAAEQQARMQQLGMQRQWEMEDQANLGFQQSEDDRRAFIAAQYKSGAWKLDAASTMKLNEIRNNMTAVRTDPKWAPQDKSRKLAELDAQWWDIMGNPPPPLPGEEEVPLADQHEMETTWKQGKDGRWREYQKITRAGATQWEILGEEDNAAEAKAEQARVAADAKAKATAQAAESKRVESINKINFDRTKAINDYRNKISTELIPDVDPKTGQVRMSPDTTTGAGKPLQRVRTPQEVSQLMAEYRRGVVDDMGQAPTLFQMPDASQAIGGMEGMAVDYAQGGEFPEPEFGGGVIDLPPETDVPEFSQFTPRPPRPPMPPPPNVAAQPRNAVPPGPPGTPRMFHPQQTANLPHPKTPEEAAKLPSGTLFVTPNGDVKKVP